MLLYDISLVGDHMCVQVVLYAYMYVKMRLALYC